MKTYTLQERIENYIQKHNYELPTLKVLQEKTDHFADELVDELEADNRLYSVRTRWTGYGTWRVNFSINIHLGDELDRIMDEHLSFITHDEERVLATGDDDYATENDVRGFDLEDFEEEIKDVIFDYCYRYWGDEPWTEENEGND